MGQPLWEGTLGQKKKILKKNHSGFTKKKEVSPGLLPWSVHPGLSCEGVVELHKMPLGFRSFLLEEPPTALLRSCCFMELFILVLLFALCFSDEIKALALWRHRHLLFCRCCSCPEAFGRFAFATLRGLFCSEKSQVFSKKVF